MERLTIRMGGNNDIYIVNDTTGNQVIDRLCEYEDTGLTPEQINGVVNAVKKLISEMDESDRHEAN